MTQRHRSRTLLRTALFSAAVGIAGVPLAVNAEMEEAVNQDAMAAQEEQQQQQANEGGLIQESQAQLHRADRLLGADVVNAQGENLGTIQDITVDAQRGRIAYAVLSFGGTLGMGDSYFAIPWQALEFRPRVDEAQAITEEGQLALDRSVKVLLNLPKERLEQAEGFDKDNWPDMANTQWNVQTHERLGQEPYWRSHDAQQAGEDLGQQAADPAAGGDQANVGVQDPEKFWLNRVSKLRGTTVQGADGESLAELHDIVIDSREGRLAYAILSYGSTLGIGGNLAAVPWSAINVDVAQERLTLNATQEQLDQVAFESDNWPTFDRAYGERVAQQFNQQPYWEVYGYPETGRFDPEAEGADLRERDGADLNVDVGTREQNVTVPDVDVDTQGETVTLPDVDVQTNTD